MFFLDFEAPIAQLYERIEKLRDIGLKENIDINDWNVTDVKNWLDETIKNYR